MTFKTYRFPGFGQFGREAKLICMSAVLLLAAWIVVGGGAARAAALPADGDQSHILRLFEQMDQTYRNRDAKGLQILMGRSLTADFVQTRLDGSTLTRPHLLERVGNDLGQFTAVSEASTSIQKLTVKGDSATALARTHLIGTLNDIHKISLKLDHRATAMYRLVKSNGTWKVRRMTELGRELRVNDQLIAPANTATANRKPKA